MALIIIVYFRRVLITLVTKNLDIMIELCTLKLLVGVLKYRVVNLQLKEISLEVR